MSVRGPRRLGGVLALLAGAVGLWAYLRYVWVGGATLAWTRHGTEYDLLAPRMLGLLLLAPYFVWMLGKSLADLPFAQRVLSVALRLGFVGLLALGLARLARTATRQDVFTVFLVDVSDSVPDEALEDARVEVQREVDARGPHDLVRLVTFARRPHVVPLADETASLGLGAMAKIAVPPITRHAPGLGTATDIASALQLAYGLYR